MAKKPKQDDLPGMQDRKIPALHKAAQEYADVRDERIDLTEQEVKLKGKLLELMHKEGLESYKCEGVEIRIVKEDETVKVKIKQPKEPIEL